MAKKTSVLQSDPFPLGSHIISSRDAYNHHGIYIGNGEVIHYSGWNNFADFDGRVERVSLEEFRNGGGEVLVFATPERSPYPAEQIIARANSKIGENDYALFSNNCEHFANWCFKGEKSSPQIARAITFAAFAMARLLYVAAKR